MGFFSKKKQPDKKVAPPEKSLSEMLLEQCNTNTQGILTKLAHKRDEMLDLIVSKGKEDDIEEGFERLADYVSGVDWKAIIAQTLKAARYTDIDNNWTNRVDVETAKLLLNMQWKIIRVDMNEMIGKIISFVEGEDV